MKRTNLILDEQLLKQAQAALETSTMSETVNAALLEIVRSAKFKKMLALAGSGIWQGDLSSMREDNATRPHSRKKA
jgi:Arc/MetJ family transcription regulator